MFFKSLDNRLQQAIKDLTKDKEFQERFSTDEKLDDLDSQKYDFTQSYEELKAIIENPRDLRNAYSCFMVHLVDDKQSLSKDLK